MMRITTTRSLRAAVAAGMALAVLGACSPSTPEGSDASGDKTTTLTVWSWRTEDVTAYEKIFDVYEKKHPETKVEFKPYKNTEYNTILATGADRGRRT